MLLLALSTDHEIGLGTAGAIFIVFSLLSAFVFPRYIEDFPTRKGMRWYLPLCGALFLGMMASVIVFGREEAVKAATTPTSSSSGSSNAAGMLTSGPYANGNAAAGKSEFSPTCAACHTFAAAGAKGAVGPNLDMIKTYAADAKVPLEQFIAEAITAPPAPYVPAGFPKTTMPVDGGLTLSDSQVADLVAFIATEAKG